MTIDERIEALIMSLELLTRDREDDRKAQQDRDRKTDRLHDEMMLAIARLANIAAAHE